MFSALLSMNITLMQMFNYAQYFKITIKKCSRYKKYETKQNSLQVGRLVAREKSK